MYCEISFPVILQMWENKFGVGADPRPFWTWWYLIYMLSSETFQLNVGILWSDPFSDRFSSYVFCVCNYCRRTDQNRCLMMGLTSHLSCIYNAFLLYCLSYSSIMSLTMMCLGMCHILRALSIFLIKFCWLCHWRRIFNGEMLFFMAQWWNY